MAKCSNKLEYIVEAASLIDAKKEIGRQISTKDIHGKPRNLTLIPSTIKRVYPKKMIAGDGKMKYVYKYTVCRDR